MKLSVYSDRSMKLALDENTKTEKEQGEVLTGVFIGLGAYK